LASRLFRSLRKLPICLAWLKTAAYEAGESAPEPTRKLSSRPPLLWVRLGYLTLLNVAF